MTEKRKSLSRNRLRAVPRIVEDLDSPNFAIRERAIGECLDFAPACGAILPALLRRLNDPDSSVRKLALKGLILAFPTAEDQLSGLVGRIDSSGPKVRLDAIDEVLMILPDVLAALSGVTHNGSSPADKKLDPVKEDPMEHAGRWVAWARDRKRVLAVADSFAEVMKQAAAAGEKDPYVKKAPGISPNAVRERIAVFEDESPDILDDVSQVFPDSDAWLDAPNSLLGGDKPRDLIGTEREREVRDLLRGIRDGITT
jgi:hypothetical protein